jgi:hypothetical protein
MNTRTNTQTEYEKQTHIMPHGLPAQIISRGKVYAGRIEKFSGNVMTFLLPAVKDFSPKMIMMLHFEMPTGAIYNLTCEFKWFFRISQDDNRLILGLKIIEPSAIDF